MWIVGVSSKWFHYEERDRSGHSRFNMFECVEMNHFALLRMTSRIKVFGRLLFTLLSANDFVFVMKDNVLFILNWIHVFWTRRKRNATDIIRHFKGFKSLILYSWRNFSTQCGNIWSIANNYFHIIMRCLELCFPEMCSINTNKYGCLLWIDISHTHFRFYQAV